MAKDKAFNGGLPKYRVISSILRNRIELGQYGRGQKLPTEDEFIKEFDVSKITIRHALSQLGDEGLIERFSGRGTFVSEHFSLKKKYVVANILDILRVQQASDIKALTIEKVKISEVRIANQVMEFFNLSGDDAIVRLKRVVWRDKMPSAYHENYISIDFARHVTKKNIYQKKSIIGLLSEKANLAVGKGEMYFEAVSLDGNMAPLLNSQTLDPAINVKVFFSSESNQPIEIANYFIKADNFRYKVNMDLSQFGLVRGTGNNK